MELKQAREIAWEITEQLKPFCAYIEVAGSIRRQRPFPNDIDILLAPGNQGQLAVALQRVLPSFSQRGKKIERGMYKGIPVDLYFATPDTWYTLLLIRTGSKAHNIKLASLSKARGWHLYADGRGLFNEKGERVAGDSETSFFDALGIPYVAPWDRG